MPRGPVRRLLLGLALLSFALLAYLVIANQGETPVHVGLLVVFGLLALRASGLRRASGEVDPGAGHLRLETEFEGPSEEDEEG